VLFYQPVDIRFFVITKREPYFFKNVLIEQIIFTKGIAQLMTD
jgi:hypothetical protein